MARLGPAARNIRGKSLGQLAVEGHWLMDGLDPDRRDVLLHLVPAPARIVIVKGYARQGRIPVLAGHPPGYFGPVKSATFPVPCRQFAGGDGRRPGGFAAALLRHRTAGAGPRRIPRQFTRGSALPPRRAARPDGRVQD